LVLLALPGSVYIYQGDELGLPEVADLTPGALQDPMASRSQGREKGRDGCRVALPWTASGVSYGFGGEHTELPQPAWFADVAADVQAAAADSTLNLYRRAIAARRELLRDLPTTEPALFLAEPADDELRLRRGVSWHCLTNFGADPIDVPGGRLVISSAELVDGRLPGDATAWVVSDEPAPR
jgi:alpha-glucosidase